RGVGDAKAARNNGVARTLPLRQLRLVYLARACSRAGASAWNRGEDHACPDGRYEAPRRAAAVLRVVERETPVRPRPDARVARSNRGVRRFRSRLANFQSIASSSSGISGVVHGGL